MKTVNISVEGITLKADLSDSPTAQAIWQALPIEAAANVWGDEIYFQIPVILDKEPEARADVEVGDLGYWPTGHAFCIFFGPTPSSSGEQPRAASPVNVFGRVLEDATQLRSVESGSLVRVERADLSS